MEIPAVNDNSHDTWERYCAVGYAHLAAFLAGAPEDDLWMANLSFAIAGFLGGLGD